MRRRLAFVLLALAFPVGCASRGLGGFAPASAERAAAASLAWHDSAARAPAPADANLLYAATLSQRLLRTDGTLAVRLRGDSVEGTLSGPFGSSIAAYRDGTLSGEKIEPVSLPPRQLRAILAGTWTGGSPSVAGMKGREVLLRWTGDDSAQGVFDVDRGQLLSLFVDRPEGELAARFSGPRDPWPERIEIHENRSGSMLRLKRIAFEWLP